MSPVGTRKAAILSIAAGNGPFYQAWRPRSYPRKWENLGIYDATGNDRDNDKAVF